MKRIALFLALLPVVAVAGPYDVTFQQRNAGDTNWLVRLPTVPQVTASGVFGFDGTTKDLYWFEFGQRLKYNIYTHVIDGPPKPDWNAASGSDAEILNKPNYAAQVNADWSAPSGVAQILNKPVLAAVATSGAYADLSGAPSLATVATTGAYADLTGKPTIPAAQVNSDWNSVSGASHILNKPSLATVATTGAYADLTGKPTIPAAQVNSDWSAVSGVAQILNKPTIPAAQVNADWNAVSGVAQILNKPTIPAAVFSFGSPNARSVSLATAYQCTNTATPCLVTITLQSQSSISLGGAVNNEGEIRIGSTSGVAAGSGTAVAVYKNNLGGTLVVGLNLSSQQANTYTVAVPTGWYFAARQTAGSGLQVVSAYDQQASN